MTVVVFAIFVVVSRETVGFYYHGLRVGVASCCELRFGVAAATALLTRCYFLVGWRSMLLCPC